MNRINRSLLITEASIATIFVAVPSASDGSKSGRGK